MRTLTLTGLFVLVVAGTSLAGPSLLITAPPVLNNGFTGPLVDPGASKGQWFIDEPTRTAQTFRRFEFYDSDAPGTIFGWVSSITYAAGPGTNIVAFDIAVTIHNNLEEAYVMGVGSNAHGETLPNPIPYAGPMKDIKICAEFAIADLQTLPAAWVPPYSDDPSGGVYYIEAVNEQELAWYCWTPLAQAPTPPGGYFVPTWDIGDLDYCQTAGTTMSFIVTGAGMVPVDPRYTVLVTSNANVLDVLWNRFHSLKISEWIDTLDIDPNPLYAAPITESNASVFFMPEPATAVLLALGGLALVRRRRRA